MTEADRLKLHVSMFHDLLRQQHKHVNSLGDVIDVLRTDVSMKQLLPELTKAVRLILTLPVTTCTAERSLSALRRLKPDIRSTMTQSRLNSIAILNCHQSYLDRVNVDAVMDEFISRCTLRRNTFADK